MGVVNGLYLPNCLRHKITSVHRWHKPYTGRELISRDFSECLSAFQAVLFWCACRFLLLPLRLLIFFSYVDMILQMAEQKKILSRQIRRDLNPRTWMCLGSKFVSRRVAGNKLVTQGIWPKSTYHDARASFCDTMPFINKQRTQSICDTEKNEIATNERRRRIFYPFNSEHASLFFLPLLLCKGAKNKREGVWASFHFCYLYLEGWKKALLERERTRGDSR